MLMLAIASREGIPSAMRYWAGSPIAATVHSAHTVVRSATRTLGRLPLPSVGAALSVTGPVTTPSEAVGGARCRRGHSGFFSCDLVAFFPV